MVRIFAFCQIHSYTFPADLFDHEDRKAIPLDGVVVPLVVIVIKKHSSENIIKSFSQFIIIEANDFLVEICSNVKIPVNDVKIVVDGPC